jgi:integrase
MPRQPKRAVIERRGKDGKTYRSTRFTAYGRRRFVSLGSVTARDAEKELRGVLADVERGTWTPPKAVEPPPEATALPTFHQFAEEWWTLKESQLQPGTREDYRTRLEAHLIPYFGRLPLDAITVDAVERFLAVKLEAGLSPRTVNMQVGLLAQILDRAVDRDLIWRNAARGRNRRVRERKPARSYPSSAGQVAALLDAASALDARASANRRHVERRAMIAVLIFAGARLEEMLGLRWRDVDLASGWLHIPGTKTDEADRRLRMSGALRDELTALRGRHADEAQSAFVFPTAKGEKQGPSNFRNRVFARAVAEANQKLEGEGLPPLPRLTPQSIRRTFASIQCALGPIRTTYGRTSATPTRR